MKTRHRLSIVFVSFLVVCAIITALSLPTLAAPLPDIPKLDLATNQIHVKNLTTRFGFGAIDMLKNNRTSLQIAAPELNAVLSQSLSQNLPSQFTLQGARTTITNNNQIIADLSLHWAKRPLGIHLVLEPSTNSGGQLLLTVRELKLGRLSLPKTMVAKYLAPYTARMPQGFKLTTPLGISIDPTAMTLGQYPAILHNPKLRVENVTCQDGYVVIVTSLTYQLKF